MLGNFARFVSASMLVVSLSPVAASAQSAAHVPLGTVFQLTTGLAPGADGITWLAGWPRTKTLLFGMYPEDQVTNMSVPEGCYVKKNALGYAYAGVAGARARLVRNEAKAASYFGAENATSRNYGGFQVELTLQPESGDTYVIACFEARQRSDRWTLDGDFLSMIYAPYPAVPDVSYLHGSYRLASP